MGSFAFYVYKVMFMSNTSFENDYVHIYIKTGTTIDQFLNQVNSYLLNVDDFNVLAKRKKYNVKPLAVTFSHNWYTEIGVYNLHRCLEVFNLDHIQFTPARKLVNKIARKSIESIGDSCWHCHAGVGAFPIQIATKFNIPLTICLSLIRSTLFIEM